MTKSVSCWSQKRLEYHAGLVISMGSRGRSCPISSQSSADVFVEELADYRFQLLASTTQSLSTKPKCC